MHGVARWMNLIDGNMDMQVVRVVVNCADTLMSVKSKAVTHTFFNL